MINKERKLKNMINFSEIEHQVELERLQSKLEAHKADLERSQSEIIKFHSEETQQIEDKADEIGVRLIAFYLPQYHPIPENDEWWGKGFTEWTNVLKARPNFEGHYQPHLPADLGFYDLRLPETRVEQAKLANQYGIGGFCYYYYWFGGKKLLNRPLEDMLASQQPNFPFCICWANENWTRRWDGLDNEILIAQNHSLEDDKNFIHSLIPAFRDSRYIRVNGKPLLLVYRVSLLPNPAQTAEVWREECIKSGIGDIYLCAVQSFDIRDPRPYGFDAVLEFPPHGGIAVEATNPVQITNPKFQGSIFDYKQTSQNFIDKPTTDYKLFKGVMPSWDNTARRQDNSHLFVNSSPENYEFWLTQAIQLTEQNHQGDEKLVFINAWNEWGEGCHLEPDQKYGHQFLEATRKALNSTSEELVVNQDKCSNKLEKFINEPDSDANTPTICTIVTKNYLAQARCLVDSFLEHHPQGRAFVLLVDKIDGRFETAQEKFTTVLVEELGIPELESMLSQYKVLELCTAVKPFFLEYLFKNYDYNKICYFDPDIYFYQPVNEIWELLNHYGIILTPHLLEPIDDEFYPTELNIILAGIYNLGFIGLSRHPELEKLLQWWHSRLVKYCYMKPEEGMHVDQNWIDFVPSRFESVYISRDPGLNAAYWDLSNRHIESSSNGYFVNGVPLKFFHFSGYSPEHPELISRYQNRFSFQDLPHLEPLFDNYRNCLYANGYSTVKHWYCAYYTTAELSKQAEEYPGIFAPNSLSGMVANEEAAQTSQQLEAVNKGQFSWGINVAGHVSGGLGIGEAVRANIKACQSADIPFVINNLDIPGEEYPDYTHVDFFSEENPYPINLIQLNADQVESFVNYAGSKYFQNRYNIGFWYWEMLTFPKEWLSAFDVFDEIWVGSSYGAEAISALSPIPVIKINPSLSLPRPYTSREELELPKDKFIFLFIFDFTSIFERKNPLATIEAFKKAFNSNNNEDVLLIIKFKNADHFPTQRDQLLSAIGSEPSIKVIDGFLTKDALYGLIYSCNCYVSLHRSEGFGLTMAEAMFYGKPVIATGYSSNLEFMNVGNSFLVKYNLITLTEDFGPYKKGNIWADADVDHAAQLMRYVFENYEQALQVGARAAYEVKSLLSPQAIGNKIKNRLEFIMQSRMSLPSPSIQKVDKVDSDSSLLLQAWIQTAQQLQVDLERTKFKADKIQ